MDRRKGKDMEFASLGSCCVWIFAFAGREDADEDAVTQLIVEDVIVD
jgi:hypothetical protein